MRLGHLSQGPIKEQLQKRKGGGGRGGGGSHSSGESGKSGSSGNSGDSEPSSNSGSSKTSSSSSNSNSDSQSLSPSNPGPRLPIQSSEKTIFIQSYGNGVFQKFVIPLGQPFAGRVIGGGNRANIFGTRRYGSGYPGIITLGVVGRDFPFGFWPVTFGADNSSCDFQDNEYGDPTNSSRPGGPLYTVPFQAVNGTSTYRVISDNTTINSLVTSIMSNCSLSTTNITTSPFNPLTPNQSPTAEQVVQYYRASSVALTLDGYNNSATCSTNNSMLDTSLPPNLDLDFLDCLNQTIGAAAPLFDGALSFHVQFFSSFYIIVVLLISVLQFY